MRQCDYAWGRMRWQRRGWRVKFLIGNIEFRLNDRQGFGRAVFAMSFFMLTVGMLSVLAPLLENAWRSLRDQASRRAGANQDSQRGHFGSLVAF